MTEVFTTVRALMFNAHDKLLLVRRSSSDPFHPGAWDIPGGRVETGEDHIQALVRECREEVGLNPLAPRLVYATSDLRTGGSGSWLFFRSILHEPVDVVLGNEHDKYEWVDFTSLPSYNDYHILLRMHKYVFDHDLMPK